MGGSRAWVHYVSCIFLWLESSFFFPETLQELISHLSITVHGSIIESVDSISRDGPDMPYI